MARSVLGKDCVEPSGMHYTHEVGCNFTISEMYLGFFPLLANGEYLKDVIQNGILVPEWTT